METAVDPKVPKMPKPTVSVSEKDAECLAGKTVGDSCTIEIRGKITQIKQPDQWEKERGQKSNLYTIEINKVSGCGFGGKREY